MNNLLERLHASFFFYILTGVYRTLQIGFYLPSAILVSVAMIFHGLSTWVDAAWVLSDLNGEKDGASQKWTQRKRPVLTVLSIMVGTHLLGAALFAVVSSPWFMHNYQVWHQLNLA